MNVAKALNNKGMTLADKHITSDILCEIDVLVGVDYLSHFINGRHKNLGAHTFLSSGGVVPYGPLPKSSSQTTHFNPVFLLPVNALVLFASLALISNNYGVERILTLLK